MSTNTIQNEIVRASAGTGKTFKLSNRYLNLVIRGVDCPSILATTFTRKAAGEILDRIVQRLSAAALDEKLANELGESIGLENLPASRCRKILAKCLHQIHRMQISTLDSFFSKLARSFSLELGLFADWKVVNQNEYEHNMLRDEAIERLLGRGTLKELVYMLGQGEASRSISQMIRTSVNNLYSYYLDAPTEAWQQIPETKLMSEQELLDIERHLETIAWPQSRMRDAALKDFEKFIAGNFEGLLGSGIANKVITGEQLYYGKEIPQEGIKLIQQLIDEAGRIELNSIAAQTKANHEVLGAYHSVYTQLKSEREIVEYDDIARGLAGFVASTSTDNLAYRTDRRIGHLLLDEFQDTSPIQWNAIRPFAEYVTMDVDAPPENIQAERSFFCVGDTKQAIYGWRGGEAEIFDTVDEQLPNVHEAAPLTDSYRSSPVVIEAVNEFFEKMPNHPNLGDNESAVSQWCDRFIKHLTQKTSLKGYATLETADSNTEVLEFAVKRIAQLYRTIPDKTIGVLVRKNQTVGKLIAMLGRLGVPASEESGNPLTDSAAVNLILSALRLADHPGNRLAWFHLQNSPLGKYFEFVDQDGELCAYDPNAIAIVSADLRARLLEEGYGRTVEGLAAFLLPFCKPRERNRLMQMVDLSFNTEFETTLRPSEFASYVETKKVSDPSAARVQVMNVHQSKGLEFDMVVLPEFDVNLVPRRPQWVTWRDKPGTPIKVVTRYMRKELQQIAPPQIRQVFETFRQRAINETLCWAYVALTRARQALHIIIEPKKNESNLPKTVAGLLRAAVAMETDASPSTTLYESGDPNWFRTESNVSTGALKPTRKSKKPGKREVLGRVSPLPADQPVGLAFQTGDRSRGLKISSPSRSGNVDQIRVSDIFRLEKNLPARQRGTLIHRWFQEIQWLENESDFDALTEERLRQIADGMPDLQVNVTRSLKDFRFSIEQEQIRHLFRRNYYRDPIAAGFEATVAAEIAIQEQTFDSLDIQVLNERSFAIRVDDEIMRGTIDRLVLIRSGGKLVAADVVDYKTDAIERDNLQELQERVEMYRSQLESYRRAVAQTYRLPEKCIAAKLVFVQTGILAEI